MLVVCIASSSNKWLMFVSNPAACRELNVLPRWIQFQKNELQSWAMLGWSGESVQCRMLAGLNDPSAAVHSKLLLQLKLHFSVLSNLDAGGITAFVKVTISPSSALTSYCTQPLAFLKFIYLFPDLSEYKRSSSHIGLLDRDLEISWYPRTKQKELFDKKWS